MRGYPKRKKKEIFNSDGDCIKVGDIGVMYNSKEMDGFIFRKYNKPLRFVSIKKDNIVSTDMVINCKGTLELTKVKLGSYKISESKKHDAIVIKKKKNTKIVIHEKGISISDTNLNEKSKNALLLLQSDNAGLLLPRVTGISMSSDMKNASPGTIVYNKSTDTFYGKTLNGWKALNDHKKDFCAPLFNEKDKLVGNVKPRPGMIIYNTDLHCFQGYSNKRWIKII